MSPPSIDETKKKLPREIPAVPFQNEKDVPMLCGPGCACGTLGQFSKWKIVIMLIILAAIAILFIYKEIEIL